MACLLLVGASLAPLLVSRKAEAYNQITSRSLTTSSGVPGKTGVTYKFTFTPASTGTVQGIKLIACKSAVETYPGNTGTCVAPDGFSLAGGGFANVTYGSQNNWQGATAFAVDTTGANDCTPSAANHNIICANRTDATAQTLTSRDISFTTIKNPTTANTAFYIGIYTYTDNAYTAPEEDFGATASAVVQTLTTNAAVAEVLNFCVGSTTVDDTTTSIATDCTSLSGTSINLGTLDTSVITQSPVPDNGGDNKNAVALVRSNAGNGVTVAYDAIQQSGTNHQGTLRISGQTCNTTGDPGVDANGNTKTDPCINAAGTVQTVFTAGSEMFGMTVGGINSGSTTSYSCQYGDVTASIAAGDTCNMKPLAGYICDGGAGTETYDEHPTLCPNGYAWDESGAAVNIASSSSSTIKQVDDEAIMIKYAATPQITTPFGPYQAQTDFIAVPTY
ncbi:MAG TPA: hypothetical protein VFJ84_02490 [Candidatus Saccharimonadales bacterium]|nr:hypothetical protein [Candidatus Saccharimonadales bacterium]